MENNENFKIIPKLKKQGNKSDNFETLPKTEDIAFMEAMLMNKKDEENIELSEKQIDDAIVYSNEVTSIDFMMPENEREIVEKNLNLYSDLEKMQKVLNIAKKNKRISEDIKTLELISKTGKVSDLLFDILTDEETVSAVRENIKEQIKGGDVMKGYKNLATANKILLDAREEMTKRLNSNGNKKNARIALKFTNDNGEDFQLGVDI